MMMESLTVTVTPSPPPPALSRPPSAAASLALPGREDCWAEDATFTLIDAWGDRHLELNRGNLRQKHWEEVADAVNRLHGHVRRRTDSQCKNRIDTLKKKYKIEKARVLDSDDEGDGGGGGYRTEWPFFKPLDKLLGSTFPAKKSSPPVTGNPPPAWPFNSPVPVGPRSSKRPAAHRSPPIIGTPPFTMPVPVGLRSSKRPAKQCPQPAPIVVDDSLHRRRFSALAAAAAAEEEEDGEPRLKREKRDGKQQEEGYREVAMAIERLGKMYERVESKKQQYMLELEKQRMQFLKDLEFQRMQLFVETELELQKIKPTKHKKLIYTSNW